jgi:DNA-binding NtrC family response regulator
MSHRVLTIDDDEAGLRLVQAMLVPEGFEVAVAPDGERGVEHAISNDPELVILDHGLPQMTGLEVLERLKAVRPDLPIVMLTGSNDVHTAVLAMKLGAFDYLTKPVESHHLVAVARRALEIRALRTEVAQLREQLHDSDLPARMGGSAPVRAVVEQVEAVAPTGFSVLVLGETGTGKELVAQAIHRWSDRRARPFIALDCGAIPSGLLESELFGHEKGAFTGADRPAIGKFRLAEGGTLFLDEVGNLPINLQSKLLRVLESRELPVVGGRTTTPLDVRFVAATNEDLRSHVTEGRFRSDLYYRLAQYTIVLPPLRDRTKDIPHLATRFLHEVAVELRRPVLEIASDGLETLQRYPWPGNVRELRNVVRQAVLEARGPVVTTATIARFLGKAAPRREAEPKAGQPSLKEVAEAAARDAERNAIVAALRRTAGNKSQAARLLKTDYKTLHVKVKNLGIRARDFAP